ncbi:MAG: outer membrane beta-barrel protein [Flavisolibacter sp.]
MKQKMMYFLACMGMLVCVPASAQWEVGASYGVALPFTGYGAVVKAGGLFGICAGHRFSQEKWKINFKMDWARMHKDKTTADDFDEPRLDIVPMTFSVERVLGNHPNIKPYVGAGMGVSIFNIVYHNTTADVAKVNASFTLVPSVGVSLKNESNIIPFLEARMVFVADGPPIAFPKAEKGTGYYGISAGFSYEFN